jgi:hypothetical protein
MDIAAFVGFAASGPVHLPVAVESADAFEAIFGGRAPLAWDPRRGGTVFAQLAPAVRAFFRGGGRRCWVVRVAEAPAFNFFPIAGCARPAARSRRPLRDRARPAAGPTALASRRDRAVADDGDRFRTHQGRPPSTGARAPDDRRARRPAAARVGIRRIAFVAADASPVALDSPPSLRVRVSVAGRVWWFSRAPGRPPQRVARRGLHRSAIRSTERERSQHAAIDNWHAHRQGRRLRVDVHMPLEDAPAPVH